MSYQVRFTEDAEADLVILYEFILQKDQTDWWRRLIDQSGKLLKERRPGHLFYGPFSMTSDSKAGKIRSSRKQ